MSSNDAVHVPAASAFCLGSHGLLPLHLRRPLPHPRSALQPVVEAAAGFTAAHTGSLYSLELLKSCIMPSQLCFQVGKLIMTGLLQPSPALLAALLRAAATPLSLHPRLVREAMRSPAFRSGNVAGIASGSWLLLLAHALSNSCEGARAMVQIACQAEEGSAAAAAAALPPSAAFAWLQLASDTAVQLVDHYGEVPGRC